MLSTLDGLSIRGLFPFDIVFNSMCLYSEPTLSHLLNFFNIERLHFTLKVSAWILVVDRGGNQLLPIRGAI